MKNAKRIAAILCFVLTLALGLTACAESLLLPLFDSATALMFDTENVTIDGKTVFTLDGERFKTAELHYVQAGTDSLYDLKLLTPRGGGEQESGWIIIANDEDIYVMERYYPGLYKSGTDDAQSTLVRRTVMLDGLVGLARSLTDGLEAALPEGAVTETALPNGRQVLIQIGAEDISLPVNAALNVAAQYLMPRYYDRVSFDLEQSVRGIGDSYVSVMDRIADSAEAFAVKNAELRVDLDDQDRIVSLGGTVTLAFSFTDGSFHTVSAEFKGSLSDYGTGKVDKFDPAAYGVVPASEYNWPDREMPEPENAVDGEKAIDEAAEISRAFWAGQGVEIPETADMYASYSESGVDVFFEIKDPEQTYRTFIAPDGEILVIHRMGSWLENEEENPDGVDPQIIADTEAKAMEFLTGLNPLMAEVIDPLKVTGVIRDGDDLYLRLDDGDWNVLLIVRVEPEWAVEYMSLTSNG